MVINDIDTDISFAINDIDRDTSLAKNYIDREGVFQRAEKGFVIQRDTGEQIWCNPDPLCQ